jgi:hypothetical protein
MSDDISIEMRDFLASVLTKCKPDYVVTVERKGTALLRSALAADSQRHLGLTWDRVLSSEALEAVPADTLRNRSILLLDDGFHFGKRIGRTADYLVSEKAVRRDDIHIAAFSVHEAAIEPVEYRFFGELSDVRYREIRQLMLQQFQREGSLLLDSEHIQVVVELNCGRLEFYDALCRIGTGVEHVSMAGRANLTIHNPVLLNQLDFLSSLPSHTTIADVIRKIRVVERADGAYAIVPIFYPSTSVSNTERDLAGIDPVLSRVATSSSAAFHAVGLYASLELFKSAFAALRDLDKARRINIRVPRPDDYDPESLSHLRATFPGLDVAALHLALERAVEIGRSWRRKEIFVTPTRIDATRGMSAWRMKEAYKWAILSELGLMADNSLLPAQLGWDGSQTMRRGGATFSDLLAKLNSIPGFEIHNPVTRGGRRRMSAAPAPKPHEAQEALISATLDELIDNAQVVTDTAPLRFTDNVMRLTRLFRLDGEVVYGDVKKASTLWRSPILPPNSSETESDVSRAS